MSNLSSLTSLLKTSKMKKLGNQTERNDENENENEKLENMDTGDVIARRTYGFLQNVGSKRFGFVRPKDLSEGVLFHFSDVLPGCNPSSWNFLVPTSLPCKVEFSLSYKKDGDHPYNVKNIGPIRYSVGRILPENRLESLDSYDIFHYTSSDVATRVRPSNLEVGQTVVFFLEITLDAKRQNFVKKATLITPLEQVSIKQLKTDSNFPYAFVNTRFTDQNDDTTQGAVSANLGTSISVLRILNEHHKPFFSTLHTVNSLHDQKTNASMTCWDCFIERQASFEVQDQQILYFWIVHPASLNSTNKMSGTSKICDVPLCLLKNRNVEKIIVRYFFLINAVFPVGALCNLELDKNDKNDNTLYLCVDGDKKCEVKDPKQVFSQNLKNEEGQDTNFRAVVNWSRNHLDEVILNLVSIQPINKNSTNQLHHLLLEQEIAPGIRKGNIGDQSVVLKIIPRTIPQTGVLHNRLLNLKDDALIPCIEVKKDGINDYYIYPFYSGTVLDLLSHSVANRLSALHTLLTKVGQMHQRNCYHGNLSPHAIFWTCSISSDTGSVGSVYEFVIGRNQTSIFPNQEVQENSEDSEEIDGINEIELKKRDFYSMGVISMMLISGSKNTSSMITVDEIINKMHESNCFLDYVGSEDLILNLMEFKIDSMLRVTDSPMFWNLERSMQFMLNVFKIAQLRRELLFRLNSYPPPWGKSKWQMHLWEMDSLLEFASQYDNTCFSLLEFFHDVASIINSQKDHAKLLICFPRLLSHVHRCFSSYQQELKMLFMETQDALLCSEIAQLDESK